MMPRFRSFMGMWRRVGKMLGPNLFRSLRLQIKDQMKTVMSAGFRGDIQNYMLNNWRHPVTFNPVW